MVFRLGLPLCWVEVGLLEVLFAIFNCLLQYCQYTIGRCTLFVREGTKNKLSFPPKVVEASRKRRLSFPIEGTYIEEIKGS